MKSVFTEVPPSVLEERRRLGIDKSDELWNGEWHLVNPPKSWHPRLASDLFLVLGSRARRQALEPWVEPTGVFAHERDWRVPDMLFARPEHRFEDGLTSAELVIEIQSPGDDTYKKMPFYAGRGIGEMLVIHQDRRFELYRLGDDGQYKRVEDDGGEVRCNALDVVFATVDGPKLRLSWEGDIAEV